MEDTTIINAPDLAPAEPEERVYNFEEDAEPIPYPDGGGIYHIRPMDPDERREYLELINASRFERDPVTKAVLHNPTSGEPVRVSTFDERKAVAFCKRFIVRIENVFVIKRGEHEERIRVRITPQSKELDKILLYPGRSKELELDVDENGEFVGSFEKLGLPCPNCGTQVGRKVAGKKTEFGREEGWLWITRHANRLFIERSEAKRITAGN